MLTATDFAKLRAIFREEIENETQAIKEELQADITMSRMRVQTDIGELKDRIKNLEMRMTKMYKDLKNEIKMVSHFLDKENMKTLKRVEHLEQRLSVQSS